MDAQPDPRPQDGPPVETRKPRVAVVFGGRSSEHAISCSTAGSVLQAIDRERYDVVPIGITTEGRWVLESGDPSRLAITSADALPSVDGSRLQVALANDEGGGELVARDPSAPDTRPATADASASPAPGSLRRARSSTA